LAKDYNQLAGGLDPNLTLSLFRPVIPRAVKIDNLLSLRFILLMITKNIESKEGKDNQYRLWKSFIGWVDYLISIRGDDFTQLPNILQIDKDPE
jgi:hypothetical protein